MAFIRTRRKMVTYDIASISKFQPPEGLLLLAFQNKNAFGIGCLRRIDEKIAEIKRMYVDPSFRGVGAGRSILQHLVVAAKEAGYKKVRLDSPKFMAAAHALYKSLGFSEIPEYAESEIPPEFRKHLLFMELELD